MANKMKLKTQELWKEGISINVRFLHSKKDGSLEERPGKIMNSTQALILGNSQRSNKNVRVLTKKISFNSKISHMVEQPLVIGSGVL